MTRRTFQVLLAAQTSKPRARDLYLDLDKPPEQRPLGLRYTLFRAAADGEWIPAPLEQPLRTGDRVRLLVECNTHGRLTVLTLEKEEWKPAAPGFPVDVTPEKPYTLPPGGRWVLDPPAGTDILALVLWRTGDESLEKMSQSAQLLTEAKVQSRDLVIETVGEKAPVTHYAIEPTAREAAKVVVEVQIRHR